MNLAPILKLSRLHLLRQKSITASDIAKFPFISSTGEFCSKRFESSSSSSTTPTTTMKFGSGEFGRPVEPPKNVTMPPLLSKDQPGPDENPYSYSPVYRKGRFDWLFGDGWRRPPAKDQGQKMRRDWICFGFHPTDEYLDWKWSHYCCFWFVTIFICGSAFMFIYKPDWPYLRDWTTREAFIEIARREKYGLPYVSADYYEPEKILATLPSDEELGDFEIII